MKATEAVVEFVSNSSLNSMPREAVHMGKRAILDTLGVSVAGVGDQGVEILKEVVKKREGRPTSSIIGAGSRSDALTAALINGTLAHALDFDDVNDSMMGHPSAPLTPAVMALGEEVGASGSAVLEAFLIGFEVECKLGVATGRSHYVKGWHATSTFGTVGAAAASAKLLGLSREQITMALGISGSLAGGMRVNFGTMTKPLHVGEAARNGIFAALLAQRGFTGCSDLFDHQMNFCEVFSVEGADPGRLIGAMGSPWEILTTGITVKKYPCCNNIHRSLDAVLEIVKGDHPAPSGIEKVDIITPPGEDIALRYSRATTGLEGKFCMQFCVASALIDGRVNPSTFDEERVRRQEVQDLSERVKITYDHEQPPVVVDSRGHVEARVVMKDGSVHFQRWEQARGSAHTPLTDDELTEKYRACTAKLLTKDQISRSLEMVYGLERLPNVKELMGILSVASPVAAGGF